MELLDIALENGYRLLLLAIPALLGAIVGRTGLLGDNVRAVGTLNVYALYIGFPALVFAGVIDDSFDLPTAPSFWLVVPVAHLLVVALIAPFRKAARGTLALVGLFGNVAYLGLPLVIGLYGEELAGEAALLVAIHVAISVSAGPYLLRKWAGESTEIDVAGLLKQPLLWAPVLGLAARLLPDAARNPLDAATSPIAASAAPVALFLLGLYVWTRREVIVGKVPGAAAHIGVRLIAVPAITAGVVFLAVTFGELEPRYAKLFVVLAGMPAAITTFSIAHDAGFGSEIVATTIVRTTLIAVVWLPLLAALVDIVF